MYPVRFLVPGTTGKFRCGGLLVELQANRLVNTFAQAEIVTYRQREQGKYFFRDLLDQQISNINFLWIVSWGFDVPALIRQLEGCPVAYHAHSSGYGFDLPLGIPILAVSRNTLGYWGSRASKNPIFFVPNAIELHWLRQNIKLMLYEKIKKKSLIERSIDVLVQKRKGSEYILKELVPLLRAQGLKVKIQEEWVENLVDLFGNAKIYLYDSSDYWYSLGITEGFGLPPLEAMACGCVVFSSLNSALADTIDPGYSGHQINCGTLGGDVSRIVSAVANLKNWKIDNKKLATMMANSSESTLIKHWDNSLRSIYELESSGKITI
uniref:Glycosyl transferase family 1 domain-containing protein n=1 Tax=Paulinella chromatophora TaxID=39717 RepID=B1X4P6_PAUCH|nr:hypothetical protein PCC_0477 [Paulinella chromatophora]ACB42915.1 hypothetical protein PCC_0477 [Paulinella chromatophora]